MASVLYIKERVWKRIMGWNEKGLFREGKEVFLKSVVQSSLAFSMSIFMLVGIL